MVKHIIFDFDGTLVDSKDAVISAFNYLAEKYKFKKLDPGNIEFLRKLSIIERAKFLDFPIYKIPFLVGEMYNLYKQSIKHVNLFSGIRDLLNELEDKGYSLAIISSNSEENIREFLSRNQIDNIKEVFCSSNIFGKDKIIKKFLKTYDLKNSEVIYIGDEKRDIVACKKVGIKVIWVGWGYDAINIVKEEHPDYIVDAPEEILKIL
ncbi:HAD-IA family hydrolase [Tissierella sp. MSJ-40]|uniref:HAD-IA family hydrolase n=1 Tax=Tissierella simiarum TaxID=2841534 RepID=A0ABS6E920_9FIRM|nr:HAD-IA family hydrolase [Tissierella simiarum]MBU5438713.1 HAD-IA family hydrolase [Tissierella simiarum]